MPVNNPLKKVSLLLGFSTKDVSSISNEDLVSVEERREIFKVLEAYYYNNVYDRNSDGGSLDFINDFLGEARANDLKGTFNPYRRIVEVYAQNVFNGVFGRDIRISDTKDDGQPIHPNLRKYVMAIAKWSNFDQELKSYVRTGAMLGTVGIRIVSKVGQSFPEDNPQDRRVYLEFEHPSTIQDATTDKRGNVKSIITEYLVNQGQLSLDTATRGTKKIKVTELATKQFVEKKTKTSGGILSIIPFKFGDKEYQKLPNQLGVVPYVLVRHEKASGLFGCWAVLGSERKIDMINALSAHIDRQIIRHVKTTWTVASASEPPQQFKFAGNDIVWFQLDEGTAPPAIVPMVSGLSLADAISKMKENIQELSDSQPELKATDGEYLSGQSGETIAQLRLPAEQKVKGARTAYEDGLIRGIKIALSWGILLGIFDFGTGTGSKEAADQAYNEGLLDFEFEERDALPITETEKLDLRIKRAEAETAELEAGILSNDFETLIDNTNAEGQTLADAEPIAASEIATTEISEDTGSDDL